MKRTATPDPRRGVPIAPWRRARLERHPPLAGLVGVALGWMTGPEIAESIGVTCDAIRAAAAGTAQWARDDMDRMSALASALDHLGRGRPEIILRLAEEMRLPAMVRERALACALRRRGR